MAEIGVKAAAQAASNAQVVRASHVRIRTFDATPIADDFVEIIVISTFFIFLRLHIGCAFTRR